MDDKDSILIVEDDDSICKSLELIFRKKGYETEVAETGREAVEKARRRFFNLALVDIRLPDVKGIELVVPLKEMHPDIAVIMITDYASLETAVQALNEGASAYIMKPVNMDEVSAKVGDALEKHRLVEDKRRAEQALRKSEERLQLLIKNAHDIIFRFELDKGYTFISPSVERLLGYRPEDYYNDPRYYRKITLPGDLRKMESLLFSLREGKEPPETLELRQFHKDGHLVHLEFTCSASRNEAGKIVALDGVARDITERKLAEEEVRTLIGQTERMSATATLAAGVAHELNNPMMGMLNFTQYCLKHTSEDDLRYPVLQDMKRETQRCVDIVQNLLTSSIMKQEGRGKYEKGALATVVKRVVRLLSYRIESEHVVVTLHIAAGTPEIWMEINSIQQVFLNIMNNALDALTESGEKEIHVEVEPEGEFVQLSVTDNGCGIAPESLERVFQPFFSTKPPRQAVGLGLTISRNIIREHGGIITCESKLGEGTTFKILLPIDGRGKETENE